MPVYPANLLDLEAINVVGSVGEGSPIADACASLGLGLASSAWGTANLALFMPFLLPTQETLYQLGWLNGATVSGNVDAGIYDRDFAKVVTTGSTAQSGTSVGQLVDIADTVLPPGLYYAAIAADNVIATLQQFTVLAALMRACGMGQMAAAFPLPATLTWAAPNSLQKVPHVAGNVGQAVL